MPQRLAWTITVVLPLALGGPMALAQKPICPYPLDPPLASSSPVDVATASASPQSAPGAAPQSPVSWTLRVSEQDGKGPALLQIQTDDGIGATCEKLTFQIGGGKRVNLGVKGKTGPRIRLYDPGPQPMNLDQYPIVHTKTEEERQQIVNFWKGMFR
jgi:hypothetical protein